MFAPVRRIRAFLSHPRNVERVGLVSAAIVSGLIAVGYAQVFKLVEQVFVRFVLVHRWWLPVLTPACFVSGWWVVSRFAPYAGGSGIPQVMAAMELEESGDDRAFVRSLLGARVAVVKVVSSLLCILGGGVAGREGPTLQVSASIFYIIGRRLQKRVMTVATDSWILAGAAAGMAAAFNTPLGGIVYAIEELANKHFARVRTTVLSSVLIAGLVSVWLVGSYLYLGYTGVGTVGLRVIPAAIALGLAGGALGASFGEAIFAFQRFLLRHFRMQRVRTGLVVAIVCALILAAIGLVDPRGLGPGNRLTSEILAGREQVGFLTVVTRFVTTMVTYVSGCAGGIFAPSLAIGASLGDWLSSWWTGQNMVLLSLLGMIAVLTGVTLCPFTSFVLILEMTDRHNAIFAMMLTALAAQGSAHLVTRHSFYEKSRRAIRTGLVRAISPPAAASDAPLPPEH
jgi:H+/Cl- antiporter ClcA